MGVTVGQLTEMLDNMKVKYREHGVGKFVSIWSTENFVDPDTGKKALLIVLDLEEDGEYIKIYAPEAFKATGPHADALLKACMMVQWKTKLVQFEYDDGDGEIRPIIEWPIEDGAVTEQQLRRCYAGLVQLIDKFYSPLKKALETGKIDL